MTSINQLIELGGMRWRKNDQDRIYFSGVQLATFIHRTNKDAVLDKREIKRLQAARFHFNVVTGKFSHDGSYEICRYEPDILRFFDDPERQVS